MEYIVVIVVALLGSCLSFFSGFGLGTLLLPAFMLFFPPQVAIAASAIVHMLNNIFKLFLVGRHADRSLVLSFGILSVVGALFGAMLLEAFIQLGTIISYSIGEHLFIVTWTKLIIGILIFCFAILEFNPSFQNLKIGKKWMLTGGLISGFFGGLSGHQGALRSAFLMKVGLSKEAFIGTRVVIACLVDLTRLSVYGLMLSLSWETVNFSVVAAACLAAFTGAYLGNRWMKKMELRFINLLITITLLIFAVALAAGWI